MRRAVLLFVKFPEPGKVKTRLAATLGAEAAAAIYRRLVAEVWRAPFGWAFETLPCLADVDTEADWQRAKSRIADDG